MNVALPLESIVIPPPVEPICIDVGVISTLLFESLPMVTVVPLILTKSVVSSFSFSDVSVISTCSVEVSPMVVVEANLPNTVLLSFSSKPLVLIFTCSAFCNPTNTSEPYSASLLPLLFRMFIPTGVIWTAAAIEAEEFVNVVAVAFALFAVP